MNTLKQLKSKLEKDFGWENLESDDNKWFVDNLLKDTIQAIEVSQQRELLLAYEKSLQPKTWFMSRNEAKCRINDFLANNCG